MPEQTPQSSQEAVQPVNQEAPQPPKKQEKSTFLKRLVRAGESPRELLKFLRGDRTDFTKSEVNFDSYLHTITDARKRVGKALTSGENPSADDLKTIRNNRKYVLQGLDNSDTFVKTAAEIDSIQSLGYFYNGKIPEEYADGVISKIDPVVHALKDPELSTMAVKLLESTFREASEESRAKLEGVILSNMDTLKTLFAGNDTGVTLSLLTSVSGSGSFGSEVFRKQINEFLDTEGVQILSQKITEDDVASSMTYLRFITLRQGLRGLSGDALDDLPKYAGVLKKAVTELDELPHEAGFLLLTHPDEAYSREIFDQLVARYSQKKEPRTFDLLANVSSTSQLAKDVNIFFEKETDAILEYFRVEKKGEHAVSKIIDGGNAESAQKVITEITTQLDAGNIDYLTLIPESFTQGKFGNEFLAVCAGHADVLKKAYVEAVSPNRKDKYAGILGNIAVWGGKKQSAPVIDFVSETLQFNPDTFFQKHNLDKDSMIEAWRHGSIHTFKTFERNIQAVQKLDELHPGASAVLARNFGIRNFGRYPVELLARQYEEREDTTKPYGIVLTAEFDDKDALGNEENLAFLQDLRNKLPADVSIRLSEAATVMDIARNFSRMKQRYGQAEFGFIHAHGNESLAAFGRKNGDVVRVADIAAGGSKAVEVFKPGSEIILQSCSTGGGSGPAKELSKLGFRVYAPNFTTSGISSIEISGGKNPKFALQFKDILGNPDPGKVYENGEAVV